MSGAFTVELIAKAVVYYSQNDEAAFFEWLNKIKCIASIGGKGDAQSIVVRPEIMDEFEFRDIIALFHRYGIDKRQLIALDRSEFKSWFHDEKKFWYADVFGVIGSAR